MISAYPLTAWLWWSGGAMLGMLGLWLLYWSLLKDRAKGKRRCPKCWYDMSATKGLRCSECGYEAKREKKLFKTHRKWRWICISTFVLLLAISSALKPKIKRDKWVSLVPTSILIRLSPLGDDYYNIPDWRSDIIDEIYERIYDENDESLGLSENQWDVLVDICTETLSKQVKLPITDIEKYRLESTASHELLFTVAYVRALEKNDRMALFASRLPVEVELSPNTNAWPTDVPVYWHATMRPVWGDTGQYRLRVMPESTAPFPLPDRFIKSGGSDSSIEFDGNLEVRVPQGIHTVKFDLLVEINTDRDSLPDDQWVPFQRLHISRTLTVSGQLQEFLKPISKPMISSRLRDCVNRIDLDFFNFNAQYPRLIIQFSDECAEVLGDLAIGIDVEIIRNGEVVAHGSTSLHSWQLYLQEAHIVLECNPEDLRQHKPEIDRWEIRVHGNGQEAFRARKEGAYWAGEFTIEVDWTDILNRVEKYERMWSD